MNAIPPPPPDGADEHPRLARAVTPERLRRAVARLARATWWRRAWARVRRALPWLGFVLWLVCVALGWRDGEFRFSEVIMSTTYTHARPAQRPAQPPNQHRTVPAAKLGAVPRMTLANVTTGRQPKPFRVLVYGVEGVGKTTFAAGAPDPIFLCGEDGTAHIDVARFPPPRAWADVLEAVRVLTADEHDYKTLAVDTLDWLEPLCWQQVCAAAGKGNIEDFGYGKGYVMALDLWRELLRRLDVLARTKRMHVVLVAHAAIKRVDDPYTGAFDRYRMKLHERAGDLIREWTDAVLFARHEVYTVEKRGRMRGVSSGARVLHTRWTAAYDAKNRFDLPETLPLDWDEFAGAARAGDRRDAGQLQGELEQLGERLPPGELARLEKARAWAGNNPSRLAQLVERVRTKLELLEHEAPGPDDQGEGDDGLEASPGLAQEPDDVDEGDPPPADQADENEAWGLAAAPEGEASPEPTEVPATKVDPTTVEPEASPPPPTAKPAKAPRVPTAVESLKLRVKGLGLPAKVVDEHVAGLKAGAITLEEAVKSCESCAAFEAHKAAIKVAFKNDELERLRHVIAGDKHLSEAAVQELLKMVRHKLGPPTAQARPAGTGFDGQVGGSKHES